MLAILTLLGLCAGISLIGLGAYELIIRPFRLPVDIALWVFMFVSLLLFGLAIRIGAI